jgi:hypothetical protein
MFFGQSARQKTHTRRIIVRPPALIPLPDVPDRPPPTVIEDRTGPDMVDVGRAVILDPPPREVGGRKPDGREPLALTALTFGRCKTVCLFG